ncbi:unnamed protein product [Amoebophrya sp. A25]|nr:unnamed protein product [Amoebophrya sp. A25]|eukprot:GSA25T00000048001.1
MVVQEKMGGFGPNLVMRQQVGVAEVAEALIGVEMGNTYSIFSFGADGMQIGDYEMSEDSSLAERCFCEACREINLDVVTSDHSSAPMMQQLNSNKIPVVSYHKPFKCTCCACPCLCTDACMPQIEVHDGVDRRRLGHVQDHCRWCSSMQVVHGPDGLAKYRVKGSHCQFGACCRCGDAEYEVMDLANEAPIGKLTKQSPQDLAGFARSLLADAETFSIRMPSTTPELDMKLLLGAAIMVDFRHYQNRARERHRQQRERVGNAFGFANSRNLFYPADSEDAAEESELEREALFAGSDSTTFGATAATGGDSVTARRKSKGLEEV